MQALRQTHSASTPIPWISIAVLVVAAFFSIYARLEGAEARAFARDALGDASAYLLEHPYLEAPPVLLGRVEVSALETARREYEARGQRSGWMITPPSVRAHQQAELGRLIENALRDAPGIPEAGVAVVAADAFSKAWLLHPLLHVSNWQLVGNAVLLLLVGVFLERSLGRVGFAALAVSTTLAGAAAWTWAVPGSPGHGLVGAGPLLAGLLVAFAVRFARHFDEGFYAAILVPGALWLALPPWAGVDWSFAPVGLFSAQLAPASAAVYSAMAGAAGAGALVAGAAWLLGPDAGTSGRSKSATRSPQFRRAMRARAAGRPREAMELLSTHLAAEPDAYEVAFALYEVAREAGRDADASQALLRVVRIELKRELAAAAIDHWLELCEGGIPEKADPSLLIHMALLLREEGRRDEAVAALRCALERSEDRASHVVAARIARAARGLDPGVVETAGWRALGFIELGLAERQAIESLIGEALETQRGRPFGEPGGSRAPRKPVAPAPVGVLPETPPRPSGPIEIDDDDGRSLDAVLAVPLELGEEGIEIQTLQGQKKLVRYERIEAVAVAAVHGMAAKPVILVDLVLNWMSPANETLRVIRLRGDRFDPRRLFPGHDSSVDALRSLVKLLIERADASALPDSEAAQGRPFVSYDDLDTYHRTVLLVDGTGKEDGRA